MIISCDGGFADPDNDELLGRHSRYGRAFRDVTGEQSALLTVLTPALPPYGSVVAKREALQVISLGRRRNPLTIGLAAGRWARQQGLRPYWIAGTPFRESVATLTARTIRRGPLQIQAHGNFGALSPWGGTLRDRARWLTAKVTTSSANSVRTVSPEQQELLLNRYRIAPEIAFIAPVPVNPLFFSGSERTNPEDGVMRIGWFGRLHRERGFDQWIQKVQELKGNHDRVELHLIGSGPHKEEFASQISSAIPEARTIWAGHLSGSPLVAAVSGLDVVVNAFRNETFGRAMVEALLCGIPLHTTESPGSRYIQWLLEIGGGTSSQSLAIESSHGWRRISLNVNDARAIFSAAEQLSILRLASSWLFEE